jgi:hypothetical protein
MRFSRDFDRSSISSENASPMLLEDAGLLRSGGLLSELEEEW